MCGDDGITNVLPFPEISNHDNGIIIKLGKDIRVCMSKIYFQGYCSVSYEYLRFYVKGFIVDTKIEESDDGPWWDIIRNEIPILEKKVEDYHKSIELKKCQEVESELLERSKELQHAKDYLNGWRWWKFWWRWKCKHDWVRGYYYHNQEECGEEKVTCSKCGDVVKNMNYDGTNNVHFIVLWEIAREEGDVNMKTIDEYARKELTVADFVQYTDGKVDFIIFNCDDEEVYNGRQEDLAWTEHGYAHPLCDKIVDYYDISRRNGCIELYLKEE
jgi:hypothetical protein